MDGVEDLRQKLDAILESISHQRLSFGLPDWENKALNSIYENVTRYREELGTAIVDGSLLEIKTPVCQISGIRKGASDLGVLQMGKDDLLIDLIDQTDSLATSLCSSFAIGGSPRTPEDRR